MDITKDMERFSFQSWEQDEDRQQAERFYPYRPKSEFYGFSDEEAEEQAISNDRQFANALRQAFVMGRSSMRKQLRPMAGAEKGGGNLRTFSEREVVDILKEVLTYGQDAELEHWNGGVPARLIEESEVLEAFETHGITLPSPPDTDKG